MTSLRQVVLGGLAAALLVARVGPAEAAGAASAVRVVVEDEGVYRLTGAALAEAGVPLDRVAVDSLNLFYGGGQVLDAEAVTTDRVELEPVEIIVEGGADGRLERDDAILFYGQSVDRWHWEEGDRTYRRNPYTGANVYWLRLNDAGPPRRASTVDGAPAAGATARTTQLLRLHSESEIAPVWVAKGNISSGLDWYWHALSAGDRQVLTAVARSPVPGPVRLRLAAYVTSETEENQVLSASWNGISLGQAAIAGRGHHVVEMTAAAAQPGVNELALRLFGGSGVLFDWYELELPHELAAERGEIIFDEPDTAGAHTYRVRGYGEAPRIFVAGARTFGEVSGAAYDPAAGTGTFSDTSTASGRRYAVLTAARLRAPVQVSLARWPGLPAPAATGAEYLIVTHGDFADQARRLADWRAADDRFGEPPVTAVVGVEEVYGAFSGGLLDPAAIRRFLRLAAATWDPAPVYVLLIGDGTYDYRDNSALGARQWVPPHEDGESTYDDWYVRLDADDRPDLAIGRLPVQTPGEAAAVVDKLIAYDRDPVAGSWRGRVLLVADDTYNADLPQQVEPFFTADAETLATRFMPRGLDVEKLYLVEYPRDGRYKPRARDAFVEALNQGSVLLTWVGHGNAGVFAHEHIFVLSTDLASVANGGRLPFLYTAASQMGVFDDPLRDSIPEALLKWPGGGAIGMVAATRVGFHASNMDLARRFHERLFRSGRAHVPVGLALLEAKGATDANRENVQRYSLFGDPLTRLTVPEFGIALEVADTLRALGQAQVRGQVVDAAGRPLNGFEGQVRLQAFDSSSLRRVTEQGVTVEYERPGVPIYRAVAPVTGGRFSVALAVPKDITYRGSGGRISAFAWAGSRAAHGSVDGLVLAGTDSLAAADLEGPEIEIGFAGQVFADGDYIPADAVLEATLRDASGINIAGDVGHHLVLSVDGERRQVTDLYEAGADFREGHLRLPLTGLDEGRHELSLEAWDTHNNWGSATVAMVVAAADGLALDRLLFHPNPMARDGHFSFVLSAPAERVEVSVFTVTGRLVGRLTGTGQRGYNQLRWRPEGGLAAGAYLYRVEARSETAGQAAATGVLQVAR